MQTPLSDLFRDLLPKTREKSGQNVQINLVNHHPLCPRSNSSLEGYYYRLVPVDPYLIQRSEDELLLLVDGVQRKLIVRFRRQRLLRREYRGILFQGCRLLIHPFRPWEPEYRGRDILR